MQNLTHLKVELLENLTFFHLKDKNHPNSYKESSITPHKMNIESPGFLNTNKFADIYKFAFIKFFVYILDFIFSHFPRS